MNTLLVALTIFGVVLSARNDFQQGRRGPHHGPPPPPFLKGVNATVRKEYGEIMRQHNQTIAQQKEKILEWARKYELENQVQEFDTNLTRHKQELQQNVTELIRNLPTINEQLVRIMNDETQTPLQMKEAMSGLKNQSRKEYDVLMFAAAQFRPKREGPKGGKHGKKGQGFPNGKFNRFN